MNELSKKEKVIIFMSVLVAVAVIKVSAYVIPYIMQNLDLASYFI